MSTALLVLQQAVVATQAVPRDTLLVVDAHVLKGGEPILASLVGAGVYTLLLLGAVFGISQPWADRWMSIAIITFGYAIGWLLGEMLSPYDTSEGQRFAQYAGAVAVFFTGYLAAKTNKLVDQLFDPASLTSIRAVTAFRTIGFITGLVVSMLTTYASREYGNFRLQQRATAMVAAATKANKDTASRQPATPAAERTLAPAPVSGQVSPPNPASGAPADTSKATANPSSGTRRRVNLPPVPAR